MPVFLCLCFRFPVLVIFIVCGEQPVKGAATEQYERTRQEFARGAECAFLRRRTEELESLPFAFGA